MFVVVNACAYGSVVVIPLGPSDRAVLVLVAEARQEFYKDLLVGHIAIHHLRVLAAVENCAQVRRCDYAVT